MIVTITLSKLHFLLGVFLLFIQIKCSVLQCIFTVAAHCQQWLAHFSLMKGWKTDCPCYFLWSYIWLTWWIVYINCKIMPQYVFYLSCVATFSQLPCSLVNVKSLPQTSELIIYGLWILCGYCMNTHACFFSCFFAINSPLSAMGVEIFAIIWRYW